jgi:hypothetical protein
LKSNQKQTLEWRSLGMNLEWRSGGSVTVTACPVRGFVRTEPPVRCNTFEAPLASILKFLHPLVHGTGSQTHKGIDPESENFETTLTKSA